MQVECVKKTYVRFYRSGPNPEHGTIYKVDKGGCSFGAPIRGDDPRDIGVFNNPYEDVEVESRDLRELDVPHDVYALQFFDRYEGEVGAGKSPITLSSPQLNWSKKHFWGCRTFSREQIEAQKAEMSILVVNLLDNMEYFGWTHVVLTPQGDYKPFGTKDILVDPDNLPPNAEAIAA